MKLYYGLSAIGGGLVGFLLGFTLSRRQVAGQTEKEVQKVIDHYDRRVKDLTKRAREAEAKQLEVVDIQETDKLESDILIGGDPLEGLPEDEPDEDDPDEHPPAEIVVSRDPTKPYPISWEEFGEIESYRRLTITFYAKCGTLADDQEQPIPDVNMTVGPDIRSRFGMNPQDPSIALIRNERLQTDFEVVLDSRSYTEVVLGYGTAESNTRKVAKE